MVLLFASVLSLLFVEPSLAADSDVAPSDAPNAEKTLTLPDVPETFRSYDAGWIRFSYDPSVRQRVQPLIAEADSIRSALRERFGYPVLQRVSVRVARTPGEMASLAPTNAPYPKYAAGVAYSGAGLILLTIEPDNPRADHNLGEIFRHELAHVALHDAVRGAHVPRWLNEGFAIHLSDESSLKRLQTLWTATLSGNLLRLRQLDSGFAGDGEQAARAYAQSADVVRFLLRRQDSERFISLLNRMRDGQSFDAALRDAYNLDLATLDYEWREEVAKRYSFWPVLLSGTTIWVGALGLFVLGWRRKRRRQSETLARWAVEEANEDAKKAPAPDNDNARVRILITPPREMPAMPAVETEVPKVEHEGSWHTLH